MCAHIIQANTNGRLHAADEPSISPLNRGFLYGDAIYEVWRTHAGVIFTWEQHWARLERSARALHFELPLVAGAMLVEIKRTVARYRECSGNLGELYIRLQVTRGGGAIGLDPALADRSDFVLLVQPCPEVAAEKLRDGLHLSLATELRRNHAGEVTEAAVSNIAFVRDGVVLTPPLSAGILGGITRDLILNEVALAAGITAREERVRPADFGGMSECFLLSTTKDVGPVAAIDAARFTVGQDTVSARLKAAFANYVRAYAAAHPELRV